MASSEPLDELYSEDEEDGEDWQDQEATGDSRMRGWNKDHQMPNTQMSDLVSVGEFKAQCKKVSDAGGFNSLYEDGKIARAMGITVRELRKVKNECK